jgi:CzcA family heavy metal efflux pump
MSAALARFVEDHGRAILLIVLSLTLAGLGFVYGLPIAIFPQTDFPRVVILVDNGITPVNIQMLNVTRPIEQAVRIVPGITNIRSITSRGSTEINVFFRWDVDIFNALHLVQGRIAQITPSLPPESRFYINRLTFSVFPMMGLSITSPTRSLSDLWELAYYTLSPLMYRLPGVAEARIVGGRQPEFHVLVDPRKLNSYGMPLTKVVDALRNSNTITSAGMVQENYHLYLTTVTGLIQDKAQIEDQVVETVRGTPIFVKNLGSVISAEQPIYNIVTADGRNAVLLNILQQPDGNAVQIADTVKTELANIRSEIPPDIQIGTFYDQSLLVRDSINGVTESILIGLVLSVIVLLAFLKSWRTTLVATLVIPIAVLIAIVCMRLFNMSFNLMTLGGIAASIGIVIDNAIVMVENIIVHLSMGKTPAEASQNAIRELTPALIGSTLTPVAVFVPLIYLSDITGVFFRALALTMVAALVASLFLSILFIPVLASWFLKSRPRSSEQDFEKAEEASEGRILQRLTARYEQALHWSLDHTKLVIGASALVLAAAVLLYFQLGTGFLPDMDEGAFVLDYRTPAGTSLEETDRVLRHVEQFLRETPEVESYSRRTGARMALAIAEPNTGDFLIRLKKERTRSLDEVTSELRHKIGASETAIEVEFPHILEDLVGDLSSAPQPIEIKIHNDDDRISQDVARRVEEWLPKVQGVVDVVNQSIPIGPSVNFRVDLVKAQRAGFGVQDIAEIEAATLDGTVASNMIRGDRSFGIRVRYPLEYRSSTEKLNSLLLTSPTGQTLPLSSIAHIENDAATYEIRRENLRNIAPVTARLEGRDLGSAMNEIQRRLPAEVNLPAGTDIEYGGLYQVQQESFGGLRQVLLGSILLILIVLVFEFRSFSHPIAILAATLLCSFGSLAALYLTNTPLNISSFMGAIMVVGILQKNGILMLDSEKDYSSRGYPLKEAIFHAGRRRLRPILMTALATLFGMLPLAIAVGSGAQMLQPLAIAVIGGIAVSLVLSLLVTPVLYYQLRRRQSAVTHP